MKIVAFASSGRCRRVRVALMTLPLIALALTAAAPGASAAGPNAIQHLAGCTDNTLAASDDGSAGPVALPFSFDFFGSTESSVFVNNNGSVSFGIPLSAYVPYDFTATGERIIAPFLADVDTRSRVPLSPSSAEVRYGNTTVGGRPAFCVLWDGVGYFARGADKLNKFQLLLVKTGANTSKIVFNYDQIQWESGDSSGGTLGLGGTSATVGFSSGDGTLANTFTLSGSYVAGALLDGGSKALIAGSVGSSHPGRYVFSTQPGSNSGSRLNGVVTDQSDLPVAGAPVEICRQGGGCVTRLTDSSGMYRANNLTGGNYGATAHAPDGAQQLSGSAGPAAISGNTGASFAQNVQLGPDSEAPKLDTTVGGVSDVGGVPVTLWASTTPVTTHACAGATTAGFTWTLAGQALASGDFVEGPAGTYSTTLPAPSPHHGVRNFAMTFQCPNPADDEATEFNIYVDPAGKVVDTAGNPVAGATVTLARSPVVGGPFVPVPSGSAMLSPSNRVNPATTDADGRFHWGIVAGYYKLTATKPGCDSATTGALQAPPATAAAVIVLDCNTAIGDVSATNKRLNVEVICGGTVSGTCVTNVVVRLVQPWRLPETLVTKTFAGVPAGTTSTFPLDFAKPVQKKIRQARNGWLLVTTTVRDSATPGPPIAADLKLVKPTIVD